MRPRSQWKTLCGALVVLGWVSLASPGVKVVRADPAEGPQSREPVATEAARCQAPIGAGDAAALEAVVADVQRRLAAEEREGHDDVISLDNNGYNYGRSPGLELGELVREVARH